MTTKMFTEKTARIAHQHGIINDLDLDFQINARKHNLQHGGITENQTKALNYQYGVIKTWIVSNGHDPENFIDPTPITIRTILPLSSAMNKVIPTPAPSVSPGLQALRSYVRQSKIVPTPTPVITPVVAPVQPKPNPRSIKTILVTYDDGTTETLNGNGVVIPAPTPVVAPKRHYQRSGFFERTGHACSHNGTVYKSVMKASRETGVLRHWVKKNCNQNRDGWKWE